MSLTPVPNGGFETAGATPGSADGWTFESVGGYGYGAFGVVGEEGGKADDAAVAPPDAAVVVAVGGGREEAVFGAAAMQQVDGAPVSLAAEGVR